MSKEKNEMLNAAVNLVTQTPTGTPIYSMDSEYDNLKKRAAKYYLVPETAFASDGKELAVTVNDGGAFDLSNKEHKDFLDDSSKYFASKLKVLKALDAKLVTALVIGIVASCLTFIPGVGMLFALLSTAAFIAALFFANDRGKAQEEYQQATKLVVNNCNWSLGKKPADKDGEQYQEALLNDNSIAFQMENLYPILDESQLRDLIDNDIEAGFVKALTEKHSEVTTEGMGFFNQDRANAMNLSRASSRVNHCIYGYERGKFVDFLQALWSIIPDLYNAAKHYITKLFAKKEDAADAADANENAAAETETAAAAGAEKSIKQKVVEKVVEEAFEEGPAMAVM